LRKQRESIELSDCGSGQTVIWIWEAIKTLIPVIPAFLAGYLVNRWKTREDFIEKRCDEMCKVVGDTAKLAQEYWLLNQQEITDQLLATKIVSAQSKLSEMRLRLEEFISKRSANEIVAAEQDFQRNLTGGDFGVHNRVRDFERAKITIFSAHKYETAIRMSRLGDIKGLWRK
jgi:hypothetical protein